MTVKGDTHGRYLQQYAPDGGGVSYGEMRLLTFKKSVHGSWVRNPS